MNKVDLLVSCPVCGETNYRKLSDHIKCSVCGSVFFESVSKEQFTLNEALTAMKLYNFVKADKIYQTLLNSTNNDRTKVMCHYGRLLACFGIIYIKDFNGNMIKTFSSYNKKFKSLKETSYFKQIKNSSYYKTYERNIEELDKEYIRIKSELSKASTYDVFICTKISLKTQDNPNAEGLTEDSTKAQILHDELSSKGLNVFYSKVDLKGVQYDSQIFSAIERSKAIIVIASKKEYLESAWVQSEWQRWINFMQQGVKTKNSLHLYIPDHARFELPRILDRYPIYNDTLSLSNDIIKKYKPSKKTHKNINEELKDAKVEFVLGEYKTAKTMYTELTKLYPNDYRPWLGLIDILIDQEVTKQKAYDKLFDKVFAICDPITKKDIELRYRKYIKK